VQVFAQPSLKTLVRARQEGFCAFSTAAALVSHQALELCSAAVWAGSGQAELFACRRWHSECAAGRGRRRVGCNAGRLHVYSRIGEGVLAFRKQAGLAVCVCVCAGCRCCVCGCACERSCAAAVVQLSASQAPVAAAQAPKTQSLPICAKELAFAVLCWSCVTQDSDSIARLDKATSGHYSAHVLHCYGPD
jgi:hypothetical protein